MGGRKLFKLRVNPVRAPTRVRNKAGAAIDAKIHRSRRASMEEALEYCRVNHCSAVAALNTGKFPGVNRVSLWRRLNGKVQHGKEREYCRILTSDEENSLVNYIKNCNRAYQPLNRKTVTQVIINILIAREANNKRLRYRNCTKLSDHARNVIKNQRLGRRFWTRFLAAHPDVSVKRKGNVSVNRALNCTREMAVKHIDELATELQDAGIMTDAIRDSDGNWTGQIDSTRVFNHDETPQFVQYGIDGTPSGLYFAGTGEPCQQLIKENRECVTIQPFVSFAGEQCMCQVIFSGKSITSSMAPQSVVDKIPHLLVSTTENGVQTKESLLAAYKEFDEYLTEMDIERPVVLVTDGHSSRFDYEVLEFLEKKQIRLFLTPPDTTGLLQLLDQINQMLHRSYKVCKDNLFSPFSTINREGFMTILGEVWSEWTSKQGIVKAAKKVGVTPTRLSVNLMQQEKFERAERVLSGDRERVLEESFSPSKEENVRKNSLEYYKYKCQKLEEELNKSRGKGLDIEAVPGLLPSTQKVRKTASKEKVRVTQVCGSMKGKKVLEISKQLKEKKDQEEKEKKEKVKLKEERRSAFLQCKEKCTCSKDPCLATGLRQCSVCLNVQKSQCSKKNCKIDGKPPHMITAAKGKQLKKRKRVQNEESESDCDSDDDTGSECYDFVADTPDTPGPSGWRKKSFKEMVMMMNESDDDEMEEDFLGFELSDNDESDAAADKSNAADDELNANDELQINDCVKVVKGNFVGYYAVVVSVNYIADGIVDIQYFKKQLGHHIRNEGDLDSRKTEDVVKVLWKMDRREHYYFVDK